MTARGTAIRTIGLFGKHGDIRIAPVIANLVQFLRARDLAVLLEQATARALELRDPPARPMDAIGREIDLAVVVGGDGTMLTVARHLADFGVPMIGVNLGRRGFLTDIPVDDPLPPLTRILDGDYQTEERILLAAEVKRGERTLHSASAFNDVIVSKGELSRLIEFETYVDDQFVNSTRADGIIVATPTGSTAYALSAGGPILHPTLPALVLVPICPHMLSDRSIVVGSDSRIEIVMTYSSNQTAHVTFDGQSTYSLQDNDRVRVRRADRAVTLVHPRERNHYEVLRAKLHWGEKF
jgi:NAD+ kinase